MPSHKGSLKNTKIKKAPISYDNRWEQEFAALKKIATRGRLNWYSNFSNNGLVEFIQPGLWQISFNLQIIQINGIGFLKTYGNGISGKGASPAEAWNNLKEKIKNLPDGYCLGKYEERDPCRGPKEKLYTPLVIDNRTGNWKWLDTIKMVQLE